MQDYFETFNFFRDIQNFELEIEFDKKFTRENSKKYFEQLTKQIVDQDLTFISFERCNSFFRDKPELGCNVN